MESSSSKLDEVKKRLTDKRKGKKKEVRVRMYAYMYVCTYVCMYVCMYVCTCICTCICIHLSHIPVQWSLTELELEVERMTIEQFVQENDLKYINNTKSTKLRLVKYM